MIDTTHIYYYRIQAAYFQPIHHNTPISIAIHIFVILVIIFLAAIWNYFYEQEKAENL